MNPVEDLREPAAGDEDTGGGLLLQARRMRERLLHEARVRAEVGAQGSEACALEPDRARRVRRAQEDEGRLRIPTDVVGDEEGRVRGREEEVHPARPAREVVEEEIGGRGGRVPDDDEPPHRPRATRRG